MKVEVAGDISSEEDGMKSSRSEVNSEMKMGLDEEGGW